MNSSKPSSRSLRTCSNGHKYYKSSDCPVCPICESGKRPDSGFLSNLAAPARRALEREGVTSLQQLSTFTKAELLALHGMGPSTIPKLQIALKKIGLTFAKN